MYEKVPEATKVRALAQKKSTQESSVEGRHMNYTS